MRPKVLLPNDKFFIVLIAAKALGIKLSLSESACVGEQKPGLVDVQIKYLFVIFEHDANGCEVVK